MSINPTPSQLSSKECLVYAFETLIKDPHLRGIIESSDPTEEEKKEVQLRVFNAFKEARHSDPSVLLGSSPIIQDTDFQFVRSQLMKLTHPDLHSSKDEIRDHVRSLPSLDLPPLSRPLQEFLDQKICAKYSFDSEDECIEQE